MEKCFFAIVALFAFAPADARAVCPYDVNCLDNPYGGRDNSAAPFNPAPYGPGQVAPGFDANPLRGSSQYDPYAPSQPSNVQQQQAAPAPGGLGAGLSSVPGGLQGLNPDQPQ